MTASPPGGPAAINGLVYQMVWALRTLGTLRVESAGVEGGEIANARLVLEPSRGGDQQEIAAERRVIVQLKARPGGAAWSLRDVVCDVLPDLYRAVELDSTPAQFLFVTEGRRGDWGEAETFFAELANRTPAANLIAALDDQAELRFRRPVRGWESFWGDGTYTRRRLFARIGEELRRRSPLARADTDTEFARKLHVLLAGFRFRGELTREVIERDVDRWLRARLGSTDSLGRRRDAMRWDLARRATRGDAVIDADAFFTEHGLCGEPLDDWLRLSEKARTHLAEALGTRGYVDGGDTRPALAAEIIQSWPKERPVLALTGEAGTGKTWLGYALASRSAAEGAVSLVVEATGDAAADSRAAADRFWHEIVGADESPPLSRIRDRLRVLKRPDADRPLFVLFDDVRGPAEASGLCVEAWERWGVRVAMTCHPNTAAAMTRRHPERVTVIRVRDFTGEELSAYLEESAGAAWAEIPADVRRTLRRPLLARLYRDSLGVASWAPHLEYELYERCWQDLIRGGADSLDLPPLLRLAAKVVDGGRYPWFPTQLEEAGLGAEALERLRRAGWLRATENGEYEVWHDRLLNWTVAEAFVERLRSDEAARGTVLETVAGLTFGARVPSGRSLAYVPLDVLWLLLRRAGDRGLFESAVSVMESRGGDLLRYRFIEESLPTLGLGVLPYLFSRLEAAAVQGPAFAVQPFATSVAVLGGDAAQTRRLLGDPRPAVQRSALQLIRRSPQTGILDRLWGIHCGSRQDSEPWRWQHESDWQVRNDTFDALRACVVLEPEWMVGAVERADPEVEPVHDLAYLLAEVGDESIWRRVKSSLFAKVDGRHERSLATCVMTFRDFEEVEWLASRIDVESDDDLTGPAALRALTRIAPVQALACVGRLPDSELLFARNWWLPELLERLPGETQDLLFSQISSASDPWDAARVFDDRPNAVEPRHLELLLDALESRLAAPVTEEPPLRPAFGPARLLTKIARPDLLALIRSRRGSRLERDLTERLLTAGPPNGLSAHREKDAAARLLAMVGGDGLTSVVNDWLDRGDRYAVLRALKLASRLGDGRTNDRLARLVESNELWEDKAPILQGDAAAALAANKCWTAVVTYYVKWGLKTFRTVDEYRHEAGRLDDVAMAPALGILDSDPTPGAVLAVGFGGRDDKTEHVHGLLRSADPGSDLAHACVITLRRLGDTAPTSVPLVARSMGSNSFIVHNTLLANGTAEANRVLLESLRAEFDDGLAIPLLHDPETAAAAAKIVRDHLIGDPWGGLPTLQHLVAGRVPAEVLERCVDAPAIRDHIWESAFDPESQFRYVGLRATAIRVLALRSLTDAIAAAEAAIRDAQSPDRHFYPYVLVELDPARAVESLLRQAAVEPKARVMRAIGRALPSGAVDSVQSVLASGDPVRVAAACRVATWLRDSDQLEGTISRLLDDASPRVADAALRAAEAIRLRHVVPRLISAVRQEGDPRHRWVLVDALAEVADPGDEGQGLPWWAEEIWSGLPIALRQHLLARIEDRQKQDKDDAAREDRESER